MTASLTDIVYCLSRGMISNKGARGPRFKSQTSPSVFVPIHCGLHCFMTAQYSRNKRKDETVIS